MDFVSSVKRNLTTGAYADFSGRASRSEYWWFYLFTVIATAAAGALGGQVGNLASIALFLPSVALFVRRLHDVGRRGWWFLVAFTIVGILQGYNTYHRLLNLTNAEARARASFESLLLRARADGVDPPVGAPAAAIAAAKA